MMGRLAQALNSWEPRVGSSFRSSSRTGTRSKFFRASPCWHQLLAEQRRTNQLLEWLGQRIVPAQT